MSRFLVAVVVYALTVGLYLATAGDRVRMKAGELDQRQATLEAALQEARTASDRRQQLDNERRRLDAELGRLEKILPSHLDVEEVGELLAGLGATEELEVDVTPGPLEGLDFYTVMPFEVHLTGTFRAVLSYLHRLSDVTRPQERPKPTPGRLLHSDRLTMRETPAGVDARLVVHAYSAEVVSATTP